MSKNVDKITGPLDVIYKIESLNFYRRERNRLLYKPSVLLKIHIRGTILYLFMITLLNTRRFGLWLKLTRTSLRSLSRMITFGLIKISLLWPFSVLINSSREPYGPVLRVVLTFYGVFYNVCVCLFGVASNFFGNSKIVHFITFFTFTFRSNPFLFPITFIVS